jgi:hypothetical protein
MTRIIIGQSAGLRYAPNLGLGPVGVATPNAPPDRLTFDGELAARIRQLASRVVRPLPVPGPTRPRPYSFD